MENDEIKNLKPEIYCVMLIDYSYPEKSSILLFSSPEKAQNFMNKFDEEDHIRETSIRHNAIIDSYKCEWYDFTRFKN